MKQEEKDTKIPVCFGGLTSCSHLNEVPVQLIHSNIGYIGYINSVCSNTHKHTHCKA